MSGKLVSRADVARTAGVSLATAAHALNNHPRVAIRTRQRIAEVAARLGYTPNHAARRLIRSRYTERNTSFDQVGFICITDWDEQGLSRLAPAYWAMMDGAEQELFKHGASLTFVRVIEASHWEKVARLVRAGGVDGWLVTGFVDDAVVTRLQEWNQRFVVVGDRHCSQCVSAVGVDDHAVGRLPVEHLAGLGHRRIARVGGELRYLYQRNALAGHREAVARLGLEADERLVVQSIEFDDRETARAMKRLEHLFEARPTAIVASEPGTTWKMLAMLRGLEREVPSEISVVGAEPQSSIEVVPTATRVELPLVDLGREAATLLRQVVLDPSLPPAEVKVKPRFVEGWSCRALAPRAEGLGVRSEEKADPEQTKSASF